MSSSANTTTIPVTGNQGEKDTIVVAVVRQPTPRRVIEVDSLAVDLIAIAQVPGMSEKEYRGKIGKLKPGDLTMGNALEFAFLRKVPKSTMHRMIEVFDDFRRNKDEPPPKKHKREISKLRKGEGFGAGFVDTVIEKLENAVKDCSKSTGGREPNIIPYGTFCEESLKIVFDKFPELQEQLSVNLCINPETVWECIRGVCSKTKYSIGVLRTLLLTGELEPFSP